MAERKAPEYPALDPNGDGSSLKLEMLPASCSAPFKAAGSDWADEPAATDASANMIGAETKG